jgi:hypothetical protein
MDLLTLLSTLNQGTVAGVTAVPELTFTAGAGTDAGNLPPPVERVVELRAPQTGTDIDPSPANLPAISGSADVYHGPSDPTLSSLLTQNGVSAYVQLLNVLAIGKLDAQAAAVLTSSLGESAAALQVTYEVAVSKLPAPLQQKDWSFSVANGALVFTQGKNKLSPQDFTDLRQAFSAANVEPTANRLASVILSIGLRQLSAPDSDSLALARVEVDATNFSDVVNLRTYVLSTVPSGKYNPGVAETVDYSRLPTLLGGMNLSGLVSSMPDFFEAKRSAQGAVQDTTDAPQQTLDASTLHGRCSCGAVRFTVEDAFVYAFYCHCSRCRARSGSAFAAIAGIGIDKVEVTTGREKLLIEGECSDGYGARCSRCYAFLFAAVRDRQYMHISLGVLVSTPSRSPDHHIYVGSKAPWHQITDDLPQYDTLP